MSTTANKGEQMADQEYKFVGNHATDLADGRMLAPGETTKLSADDVKANQGMIDEELLISTKATKAKEEGS